MKPRPVSPIDRAFMRDLENLCRNGKTLGIRNAALALLRACEDACYHQVPFGLEGGAP